MCSTKNSSLQPSEAHASCCVSAIRGTGSTVVTAARSDRRHGPHPTLRPAEVADLGGHDTALRFTRRWKGLPSRYSTSGPESRSASVASCTVVCVGSAIGDDLPPGRPCVVRTDAAATVDRHRRPARLLDGRRPCRLPAPVDGGHDAGGWPVAGAESLERLAAASTRVRARPVVRRRAADRSGRATRASRRARARGSSGARSRRGGTPCSRRTRRPCRCSVPDWVMWPVAGHGL